MLNNKMFYYGIASTSKKKVSFETVVKNKRPLKTTYS